MKFVTCRAKFHVNPSKVLSRNHYLSKFNTGSAVSYDNKKAEMKTNLSVSDANGCTTNDVPIIISRSHFEKSYNHQALLQLCQLSVIIKQMHEYKSAVHI